MYTRCEMISFVIVRTIQLGRIRCCSLYDVYMFIRIALYTRGTLCPGIDHVWLEHIITKQTVFDICVWYVLVMCARERAQRCERSYWMISLNDFYFVFIWKFGMNVRHSSLGGVTVQWQWCAVCVSRYRIQNAMRAMAININSVCFGIDWDKSNAIVGTCRADDVSFSVPDRMHHADACEFCCRITLQCWPLVAVHNNHESTFKSQTAKNYAEFFTGQPMCVRIWFEHVFVCIVKYVIISSNPFRMKWTEMPCVGCQQKRQSRDSSTTNAHVSRRSERMRIIYVPFGFSRLRLKQTTTNEEEEEYKNILLLGVCVCVCWLCVRILQVFSVSRIRPRSVTQYSHIYIWLICGCDAQTHTITKDAFCFVEKNQCDQNCNRRGNKPNNTKKNIIIVQWPRCQTLSSPRFLVFLYFLLVTLFRFRGCLVFNSAAVVVLVVVVVTLCRLPHVMRTSNHTIIL